MRVYLSSTFRDLQSYRDAAAAALQRLGFAVVQMEHYGAENRTPLAKVMQDIRGCDAFVGLYAWRLGSKPSKTGNNNLVLPDDIKLGVSSYTQCELAIAKEAGVHDFLFVLEDTVPWPPYYIDGLDENSTIEPIKALRKQVQVSNLVAQFRSPEDLATKVATSLSNFEPTRQFLILISPAKAMDMNDELMLANTEISESSLSAISEHLDDIATAVASDRSVRVFRINIDNVWWSTRLLLLAALGRKLSDIQRIMITGGQGENEAFVGLISTDTVISKLLQVHPELKDAIDKIGTLTDDKTTREEEVKSYIEEFRQTFSQNAPSTGAKGGRGKKSARSSSAKPKNKAEWEHSIVVTREILRRWFGDALLTKPLVISDAERPTRIDLALVTRYPHNFVPIELRRPYERKGGKNPTRSAQRFWVIDQSGLSETMAEFYLSELFAR